VTASAAERRVTLLSEPAPGPRFRLTYAWSGPDALTLRFEIAPSGAPEAFRPYLEAAARRRGR